MKQNMHLILSAVAVSLVGFSARAENPSHPSAGNSVTSTTERVNTVSDAVSSGSIGTNAAVAPDNTARNVRDRNERTLTPLDQGNSQADVERTARIRKEVLDGKNLSVNAQNAKIITRDGRVTLRGPVASTEEKRLLGEIATRIARPDHVDNQLEVIVTSPQR